MMKAGSKSSKVLTSSFIIAIIALSMLSILAVPAQAVPSTKLATLSNCSVSTGLFYGGGNLVWQLCYDTGLLYKEDFSTDPATLTSYDISSAIGLYNGIAIWGDSSNLYVIGRGVNPYVGGVVQAQLSSPTSTTTPLTGLGADVLYPTLLSGFLYIPFATGVAKFNTATGTTTTITTGVQMFQCANNGSLVFCTAQIAGEVYEVDPATNTATLRFSGLSQPYGIDADSGFVYVAQHGTNSIKKISTSSWTVSATGSLPSGATPYGVAVVGSFLVATSDGSDLSARNVYVLNKSTMSIANTVTCPVLESGQCRPLFIIISDGVSLFVGFQGSAGTAKISGWEPATTTTTGTGGGQPAGSWTPITNPTITLTSTGLGGQHNIYITRNGSTLLTGFLWLPIGGSVGTFNSLGICQTASECQQFGEYPSPSQGTFKSLAWTTPPVVEGPQPQCSLVPYLWFCKTVASPINSIQTSQTYYGIFCDNAYIVNTAKECNGNGIPISYQTFGMTISNLPLGLTVVRIQATGTSSGSQASIANVFVYNVA